METEPGTGEAVIARAAPRNGGTVPADPARAGVSGRSDRDRINNAFYDDLGDRWHNAYDDPVALLRAEGKLKHPWIAERLRKARGGLPGQVLDIGCGAGFLADALANEGHRVIGMDLSLGSLKVAQAAAQADWERRIPGVQAEAAPGSAGARAYLSADAYRLPFPDACFDAVTALDFLEHVSAPDRVVAEAARVLRPGGLFFFHTFNRNPLAWLIIIKGVEWFVRNTPKRMHVLPLFIKPEELRGICARAGMRVVVMTGMRPVVGSRAFWKLLATRRVPRDFRFRFTPSLALSYLGCALKA
jgi:2-polyprenyl-6-hydroxyphenyl methylase/3-demethylubiquinone-9 3-methyltransferase